MKFWLRACPKCGGDLELVQEVLKAYVECVQCGLELNPMQERSLLLRGHVSADLPVPSVAVSSEGRHQRIA